MAYLDRADVEDERQIAELVMTTDPWLCHDAAPAEFPDTICAMSIEHAVTLDEHPDDPRHWHGASDEHGLWLRWDAIGEHASVRPDRVAS